MRRLYDDSQLEVQLERYAAQGGRPCVFIRFTELSTRRALSVHLTAEEADEFGACLAAFAAEAAVAASVRNCSEPSRCAPPPESE